MSDKTARLSRRSFLLTLGAGGAATAAVVATRSRQGVADNKAKARKSGSYQDSAHIRNYYRTAKV